ncbi:hypothetical protein COCMIDRAFT_9154 [Bipolaris oryzae ATCC 44560]|uniref:Uncharacterized protein n=1 Tax=Bipolaris oryzae ATCC 44560 TaxID=930090 RepID=W6YU71_COCMI|nr:uncharacterized protein COCMIDRAFT_9154 [Bipolaris oryzae ATCC 44560]EUC41078.1 hypothetical protein COCMIDRAFT_9154 [Bipolaris oryzae ATCC 44560]
MADPLSIAASIAGLYGLAIQIAQLSFHYFFALKSASDTQALSIQEISILTSVFLRLRRATQIDGLGDIIDPHQPVISKMAIEDCKKRLEKVKVVLKRKASEQSVRRKLGTLLWPFQEKLLDQDDTVPEDVINLWKKKSTNSSLLPDKIVSIISNTIKNTPIAYVVLDSLEEGPFLVKLAKQLPNLSKTRSKIFATSRDPSGIRRHIDKSLYVEILTTKDTLVHYIDCRLQEKSKVDYDLIPQSLKSNLIFAAVNHVDGCFLVAWLIMDHMTILKTIKKMRQALESPPVDYKKAYGRTTERIAKQNAGRKTLPVKTPLHWTASMGHHVIVHALLQRSALMNAPDAAHWTPLFWAAFKGHKQAISTLLDYGADCYRADRNG